MDTATSGVFETPQALEPDVLIFGDTMGYTNDAFFIDDMNGDGFGDIALTRAGDLGVFFGPLESGSTPLESATISLPLANWNMVARAGDVDGDGSQDLWMANNLYKGPLTVSRTANDSDTEILSAIGGPPVGGFDADGDGHLDVAITSSWLNFVIHYGPFDGDRPGYYHEDFDPSAVTQFLDWSDDCRNSEPAWVGPMNSPGEKVLLTQGDDTQNCSPVSFLVDVTGSRGRILTDADAIASADAIGTEVLPDSDGDGLNELVYRSSILEPPLLGTLEVFTNLNQWSDINDIWPMEDLTGDGLGDMVVDRAGDEDAGRPRQFFVMPGYVRGDETSATEFGIYLTDWSPGTFEFTSGDLDGDGLVEIIGYGAIGETRIWRGAAVGQAMREAGVLDLPDASIDRIMRPVGGQ